MKKQFDIDNISPEWMDLAQEFPRIFLEPSPEVLEMYYRYGDSRFESFPNELEECCNLRYGFECPIEWKGIIREFCLEMEEISRQAAEKGEEIYYTSCILKEKFGSCRDQGSIWGKDKDKYYDQWREASNKLLEKSIDIPFER